MAIPLALPVVVMGQVQQGSTRSAATACPAGHPESGDFGGHGLQFAAPGSSDVDLDGEASIFVHQKLLDAVAARPGRFLRARGYKDEAEHLA
jgi:hypothetical protein